MGEAEHGYRAVELGLSLKPDVILMDLLMPGLAGVEAIGELIRGGSTSRIVVLTSSVDDRMVLAAIRAGAFSYILKTSSAEQLAQAIRQAVAGYPTCFLGSTRRDCGLMETKRMRISPNKHPKRRRIREGMLTCCANDTDGGGCYSA